MRWFWILATFLLSFMALCGCGIATWFRSPTNQGIYMPPPVSLTVKSFSCTPPNPVHPGDTLTFYAELEPVVNPYASVIAWLGRPVTGNPGLQLTLKDDGIAPDVAANDNIFSGSTVLPATSPGEYAAFGGGGGLKNGESASGQAQLTLTVLP
jgi:hypothetical protein